MLCANCCTPKVRHLKLMNSQRIKMLSSVFLKYQINILKIFTRLPVRFDVNANFAETHSERHKQLSKN